MGWAAAFVAIISLMPTALLGAQSSSSPALGVGVSVGLFADYPRHFSPQSCEQRAGGVAAKVGREITSLLALEASALVSFGVGELICVFPSAPAPPDGGYFNRATFEDGIVGQSFFATTISALLQPLAKSAVSPHVRIGAGRLWDKKLWTWMFGGGLRVGFGENAIVADIERWNLEYDLNLELWIYRDSGAHELQRVDVLPQRPKPYLFRVGWERRVG
jgi:hypothetical protein